MGMAVFLSCERLFYGGETEYLQYATQHRLQKAQMFFDKSLGDGVLRTLKLPVVTIGLYWQHLYELSSALLLYAFAAYYFTNLL